VKRHLEWQRDFHTEAALCTAFIEWLKTQQGWTPYAETAGWDILLVHADGTQVGVQAKLKFNISVLCQAIESGLGWDEIGPDFRAIMVPQDQGADTLCAALGLTLIRPRKHYSGSFTFEPSLDKHVYGYQRWHFMNPKKRHELPKYVPDVPAGVPSPSALTKWKIAALEICAVIELRGYVRLSDFRLAGIDHRRWRENWLEPVPDKPGDWRWLNGNDPFSKQHPVVYPQVLAKVKERGVQIPQDGKLI